MKALSRTQKILVLGLVLVMAPAMFLTLRTGRHTFDYLPYYGDKEVNAPGDTTYYQVPPFTFTDAYGNTVTDRSTEGKIIVADFFFTQCTSICPRMTRQMQQLQFKLNEPAYEDILFLSHTVDPQHDSLEVLRKYARKWQADSTRWKFVTGDPASIYFQGNNGYLLSAMEDSTAAEQFVHDERFVLVDKRRHIRGYYDGTDTEEVGRLLTDLKMLMKEERERALKVGRFKE
jgi:protein SCO1/2